MTRATAANQRGDFVAAAVFAEDAVKFSAADPDPQSALTLRLQGLFALGAAALGVGDLDISLRAYQEIIDIAASHGETVWRSYALFNHGLVAWHRGEVDQARGCVQECLRVARDYETEDRYGTIPSKYWRGSRRGNSSTGAPPSCSARPTGCPRIAALRSPRSVQLAADHDACERQVRQALGEAEFSRAFRQGCMS